MLNLINDPWIPVIRTGGEVVLRPDQIAQADMEKLNWPRADLNLACMELLIGLVYLAHPCANRAAPPDAAALRAALAPLAPAFNLLGNGPRFLQDMKPLEGEPNPPDMLFIDSAGILTAKKNTDLMVRRGRYQGLPFPLAAMALYTMQAFAPAGGAGNRTSMRGGGPMVTLVRPEADGLWPQIWANVPHGTPLPAAELHKLPWMRETVSSKLKGVVMVPDEGSQTAPAPEPEVFFGQPRRLRLVANSGMVTGVIQRPYGNNYQQWRHPLSPYYTDAKGQTLPVHPKPGAFGYRNWRGVLLASEKGLKPQVLTTYLKDVKAAKCSLIVAGWAMDKSKPQDFIWSEQPVFTLSEDTEFAATDMVEAAEAAGYALKVCVAEGADKNRALAALEGFYSTTQAPFEDLLAKMAADGGLQHEGLLQALRKAALAAFDAAVLPGLPDLAESKREKAIKARGKLLGAFSGFGLGKKIFTPLGLVAKKKKETV